MKFGRKLIAFMTVFLMIFGNGLFVSNAYACYPSIKVTKSLASGNSSDTTSTFTFKITRYVQSGSNWVPATGNGSIYTSSAIHAGDTYDFTNLTSDGYYKIEEINIPANYLNTPSFQSSTNSFETKGGIQLIHVQNNVNDGIQLVTCTNTKTTGSIKVKKLIDSNGDLSGDNNIAFHVLLYQGTALIRDLTANLKASDGYVQFDNIPLGSNYKIVESGQDALGFALESISYNGSTSITSFTLDGSCVYPITVTNKRLYSSGQVTITKDVLGTSSDSRRFDLTITGTFGGVQVYQDKEDWIRESSPHTVTLTNLPYGTYTIVEDASDLSGYKYDGLLVDGVSATGFTIDATTSSHNIAVVVQNEKKHGSITVTKSVTGGTPLPGTVFTFSLWKNGTKVGSKDVVWGTNNSVTFGYPEYDLNGNDYRIKEETSAPGFTLDSDFTGYGKCVSVCDSEVKIACNNRMCVGSIIVSKAFSPTGSGPASATLTFELYYKDNGAWKDTGKSGAINWPGQTSYKFDNLAYGTYSITEISSLPGYSSSMASGSSDIIVDCSSSKQVTCTNTKLYGSLTLHKAFDGATTAGANDTFDVTVTGINGTVYSQTLHLKANGEPQTLSDLPYGGTFQITESGKSGYQFLSVVGTGVNASGQFTINSDHSSISATVTNKQLFGSITLHKAFDGSAPADPNETFDVTVAGVGSTVYSQTLHLKADGTPQTLSDLPYGGTFQVIEAGITGYQLMSIAGAGLDSNNQFAVNSDHLSFTVTVTNKQLMGSITLHKEFSGAVPADPNETFDVTVAGTGNTTYSQTLHLKADGTPQTLNDLPMGGTFQVSEAGKSGYQIISISGVGLDANGQFTVNGDQMSFIVTVKNEMLLGKITIHKAFTENSTVDPNETFDVTVSGTGDTTYSQTLHLKADGTPQTLSDLPYGGTFQITEAGKSGYQLVGIAGNGVDESGNFTINGDFKSIEVTVTNEQLSGSITLHKAFVGNTTAGPDDTFDVTVSGTGNTVYSQTLHLKADGTPQTLSGLPYGGTFKITEAGKTSYQLVSITGSGVNVNGEFTFNSDFRAITATVTNQQLGRLQLTKKDASNPNLNLSGATFRVISVADSSNIFQLTTGPDGTITSGWLVPGNYTVQEIGAPAGYHIDDPSTRTVTVYPGSTTSDANTVFTDSTGSVKVQKFSSFGNAPVGGVIFQLLRNPPQADGSINNGDLVGEATTNVNGVAWFYGLPVGTDFWVREIQQAPGFDIDKTIVFKVTASYNPAAASATFVNNPLGKVSITKYDAATVNGNDYTNGTKLGGAVYGIYASTDYTKAPVATITTSDTGAVQSADLPFGGSNPASYYVKEITAPAGYVLSDTVQTVTFTAPGQVVELVFTNTRAVGSLIIKKVDALNPNQTLDGAEFTLYSDEALTTQVGVAVTTGADGIARFDSLVPGNYWLMETKAPTDYDPLTVSIPVTVAAGVTNPDPLVITNQYNPPKDIQTGTMDWNILLIGAFALLAGGLLVFLTRKRRMNAGR